LAYLAQKKKLRCPGLASPAGCRDIQMLREDLAAVHLEHIRIRDISLLRDWLRIFLNGSSHASED
jgi:hypothetical protein